MVLEYPPLDKRKPSQFEHQILIDLQLSVLLILDRAIERTRAQSAAVVQAPGDLLVRARGRHLAGLAAAAGRIARIVASIVCEDAELVAGEALVVRAHGVSFAVGPTGRAERGRFAALAAVGGAGGRGCEGDGLRTGRVGSCQRLGWYKLGLVLAGQS